MEQLSIAYVRAVATAADWKIGTINVDTDSVDGSLLSDIGNCPRIDYQLKSTAQDIMHDDGLHYWLRIKNYNHLRKKTTTPRILIVMWMPKNEADWHNQTRDELCLRHCCYWMSLEGMPPPKNPDAKDEDTIKVTVPIKNVFDVAQLNNLTKLIDEEREQP